MPVCGAVTVCIVSLLILASIVSQVGHFHKYWVGRSKEWEQAAVFSRSENCINPMIRSKLGAFNLCETSETIMSSYPLFTSIHDVAQDLNICGHNRCAANIHKVVIGGGLLAFLGLYVSRRMFHDNAIDHDYQYYALPSHRLKHKLI
jgi:hypothetical protein